MSIKAIQRLLGVLCGAMLAAYATSFFVDPLALLRFTNETSASNNTNKFSIASSNARPLREYESVMRGKAVFRYALQEEPAAAQRSIIDDFKFLGTSRAPSGSRAFLQNTITNQTRTVSVGDEIGDYRVNEIRPGGVSLSKGGEQVELKR